MPYIGNPIYQSAFVTDQFSGNGSTTAFTMSVAPAGVTNVLVAVSGVLQDPSTYGVVGNTITFSAAPPSGTGNISCRYLGVPASGVTTTAYRTVTEFTATASQTTFTPPSYTPNFINVYLNGVLLGSADYTATNGTTVVLATGASAGNLLTVESFLVSSVLNAIPNTAGSVLSSNISSGVTINFADGSASTPSITNDGDTNTGIFFPAADTIAFSEGGTEAMRLDSSGNVGIGTSSPLVTSANRKVVTLNGTTDAMYNIGVNGTYTGFFYSSASNTQIGSATSIPLQFYTGDTERMRIDSSGRVTTPFQPAFSAFNSVDFSTGQSTITYNSTALNIGSNYSTSTGRFTAPVAGCYIFFHRLTTSNNVGFESKIEINGSEVSRSYVVATGSIRTITTTAICYLNANDYAQPSVYVPSTTTFNAGSQLQSNFHGYLLG